VENCDIIGNRLEMMLNIFVAVLKKKNTINLIQHV